ncbi:MAG TPA: TolC family protein [Bacteroidia bacterium]|nr:TolC family protein [Bacteroidia bacterium]
MKRKLLKWLLSGALLAGWTTIQAQQLLTLNEAIEIALKNNYDILLVKNETIIADINNTPGNAGMLPDVSLNATYNTANNTINQEFTSGLSVQRTGVGSNNLNANIALEWTVFDGFRMFAAKDRLEELQRQSDFNLKEQLQTTIAQVMQEYYGLVGQKMQIKATEKTLEFIRKRAEIINTQFSVGSVSAFEVNQVNIDLNTYESNLILQQNGLNNLKMGFNTTLARDAGIEFDVPDTIVNDTLMKLPAVEGDIENKNFALLSAQRSITIAQLQKREISAQRYPWVGVTTTYSYTRQQSEAGFSLLNQSNGLNFGIGASIPLFRSFPIRTQEKIGEININTSELVFKRLRNEVDLGYRRAYNNYLSYIDVANIAAKISKLSNDNLSIAEGRLRQGLSTLLEVKEADRNYQDAQTRLIDAQYNLKLAEIELQRLRGELVK